MAITNECIGVSHYIEDMPGLPPQIVLCDNIALKSKKA